MYKEKNEHTHNSSYLRFGSHNSKHLDFKMLIPGHQFPKHFVSFGLDI